MPPNQKGFTYPLLLMVIILLSFFFTYQVQFYLAEKRILYQTAIILKQEYYMLSAVKKVEAILQSSTPKIGISQYVFHDSMVTYRIENQSESLLKITITLKLNSLEEAVGYAYYDKGIMKITKWVERN
jgi:hypothetical protein